MSGTTHVRACAGLPCNACFTGMLQGGDAQECKADDACAPCITVQNTGVVDTPENSLPQPMGELSFQIAFTR